MVILSSYALQALPVSWFGVALVFLAFLLLVVDLIVTNHGLPTIGGMVALVVGVLMLFGATAPYFLVLLVVVVVVAILVGALFMGALSEVRTAKARPPTSGIEGMIGEVGVVKKPVGASFSGWVFVHGEWWRATTTIAPENVYQQDRERVIGVGRRVLVVGLEDGKITVVPFEPNALEHSAES